MDYFSRRRVLIERHHLELARQVSEKGLDQRVVILLPGGMGSQLDRSARRFDVATESEKWDPIWIDLGLLFDAEIDQLLIDDEGRDEGQHIVRANGELRLLGRAWSPYRRFTGHFDSRVNLVTLGYDWRRSIPESANWLSFFIDRLHEMFRLHGRATPPISLVAHSMGGLVATYYALSKEAVGSSLMANGVERLITVATPFYGTATHLQRYYIGEPVLSQFGYSPAHQVGVIRTMPGPYALMEISRPIFAKIGAAIGLQQYPIQDSATGDPADPFASDSLDRYPGIVRSMRARIEDAARVMYRVGTTAPQDAGRYYCLRAGGSLKSTASLKEWERRPSWRFGDAPPLTVSSYGPGDGTVPLWSGHHAYFGHKYDLPSDDIAHMTVMEHADTIYAVQSILDSGALPSGPSPSPHVKGSTAGTATNEAVELLSRMRGLPQERARESPRRERSGSVDEI